MLVTLILGVSTLFVRLQGMKTIQVLIKKQLSGDYEGRVDFF